MSTRTIAVVQTRLGSTRLPRKVLRDLGGQPVLAWVVARLRRATSLDDLVIATTVLPEDDELVHWCDERGVNVVRGHPEDLLDRYLLAGRQYQADVLVRVTSDCPLIDPAVVDAVVGQFRRLPGIDYCSNTLEPRTYPRGLDAEVFALDALERASREDLDPGSREHVTPHLKDADGYSRARVDLVDDLSGVRWTVDTVEDLSALRLLVAHFDDNDSVSWVDALDAWNAHPEWGRINAHIQQKPVLKTGPLPGVADGGQVE